MYTQKNLLLSTIASKSNVNPELACIAFYGNRTVATDSFRVVEIETPGGEDALETPILLNAKDIKQRVKMDKDMDVPLEYIMEVYGLKPVEGNYPEIDKVITPTFENEDVVEIKFDAKLLLETLQVFVRANKNNGVTLRVPKTNGGHNTKGMTIEADGIRAIVMPRNK